jgi:hypothetical protein
VKGFDKTLTQAERDAPTYLEWSDSTIARLVRQLAVEIDDSKGDKAIFSATALKVLAHMMEDCNAENMKTSLKGDVAGKPFELQVKLRLTKPKEVPA